MTKNKLAKRMNQIARGGSSAARAKARPGLKKVAAKARGLAQKMRKAHQELKATPFKPMNDKGITGDVSGVRKAREKREAVRKMDEAARKAAREAARRSR